MRTTRELMRMAKVYDKHAPDGKQDVAIVHGAVDEDGKPWVLFATAARTKDGVQWLSKQHAVEFASCMLMIALSLPGDIPAGDMTMTVNDHTKADDGAGEEG